MAPLAKPSRRRKRHFIREWREAAGFTQMTAAEALGVRQSTISKIERGLTPYDQDFLETCAPLFGCTHAELIARAPQNSTQKWNLYEKISLLDDTEIKRVLNLVDAIISNKFDVEGEFVTITR